MKLFFGSRRPTDLRGGGESENLEKLCESMSTEPSEPKNGLGQKLNEGHVVTICALG